VAVDPNIYRISPTNIRETYTGDASAVPVCLCFPLNFGAITVNFGPLMCFTSSPVSSKSAHDSDDSYYHARHSYC